MSEFKFINLSTGLEFDQMIPDGFCRFQSSQLESKAWGKFLDGLDNNMLYLLSQGHKVIIHDCGSRRADGCSRVIWQGIPLIKYILSRVWKIDEANVPLVKGLNCINLFDHIYRNIDRTKFKYFRKHLKTDKVKLSGRFKKSLLDGRICTMTDEIKTGDDLKPCPFCGCDPSCTSVYNENNGANDILFGCHNQDCIGPYTDDFCSCEETESYIADLSKQWNTRYEGKN